MKNFTLSVFLLTTIGCTTTLPIDIQLPKDAPIVELTCQDCVFKPSPKNLYSIVLKGKEYSPPQTRPFKISTADDIKYEGIPISSPCSDNDVDQITKLLVIKGYDVYKADMGIVSTSAIRRLLEKIASVSNNETKLFFAYSGEGGSTGLRTRTMRLENGSCLVPADGLIAPEPLFEVLDQIKGSKALLLNACESGVFPDKARFDLNFQGVVIAACPVGYATTPHEPTGTSAIFASFLKLYSADPTVVKNLSTVQIDHAGSTWTNFEHKWVDFWFGSGLPISYEPVIYSTINYSF
jgi:hypothetical protein